MTKQKLSIGSIICGILTLFGIVSNIISIINNGAFRIVDAVLLIMAILIDYYVIRGYQKPHGNLLKITMLLYAASYLFTISGNFQRGFGYMVIQDAAVIGLICFVAGRLNRVKQNLVLMILITVCTAIGLGVVASQMPITIGVVTRPILWLDICVAYFLRYKEHKEAGLPDK